MIPSIGARATGLRLERMKASPRFVDGSFRNTLQVALGLKKGTAAPTISEFLCGGQRRPLAHEYADRDAEEPPSLPPTEEVPFPMD